MKTIMKTKRAILTTLFLTLFVLAFSQSQLKYDDAPEHLMFNNMPMNGGIGAFANKLTEQGFTLVGISANLADFSGKLNGKECTLTVYGTEKTKNVYNVIVYFMPEEKNWLSVKKEYLELKKIYQTKYGTGSSIESFSLPYAEGDGNEMDAVKDMKCTYSTEWKSDSGKIVIMITYDGQTAIDYKDTTNELKYKSEKSTDDGW